MRSGTFFASVGSVLAGIAHRYGLETKLAEHRLQQRWAEIAGAPVAAHTRPDAIRFKKLHLVVENSVWLHQLTFLKPTLIRQINAAVGRPLVSEIVLRVGDVSVPVDRGNEAATTVGPVGGEEPVTNDPAVRAQAAAYADRVTDPALRARLEALMARALSAPPEPPNRPPSQE